MSVWGKILNLWRLRSVEINGALLSTLGLLVGFGLDLTPEQIGLIMAFYGAWTLVFVGRTVRSTAEYFRVEALHQMPPSDLPPPPPAS